ncbi:E2 protein [Delphinus delphis papillomavirus 1]|uniref:Regulatory protein E2 n=1 Tax=Delphinus delphis papillomavirus TaxID=706524 RepID=F2VIQ2_9PAPI|nr:E2 protein [Delphinus delphis papillomavirus]
MEALCDRLDALQETQMELIESDDGNLHSVLKYFRSLRSETMLLYAANQRGLTKVGLTRVPNKQACEANARKCIMMHLAVSSLLSSEYANEQWFLSEMSHEMYTTPPAETFKKKGRRVIVTFDNDKSNCMEYTCWSKIYYQLLNGGWVCVAAVVCHEGLFFDVEGERRCYVDFEAEAVKYGTGKNWTVFCDGECITDCTLVSSTSNTSTSTPSSLGHSTVPTTTRVQNTAPGGSTRKRNRHGGPPPFPPPSPPPAPPAPPEPPSPPPEPPAPPAPARAAGPEGQSCSRGPVLLPQGIGDSCRGGSDSDSDCDSAKRPRVDSGIPCVLIAGGANQVKCFRHKLKVQHKGLYRTCSTTWSWVGDESPEPNHRICVSFNTPEERAVFLKLVPVPSTAKVGLATLPF